MSIEKKLPNRLKHGEPYTATILTATLDLIPDAAAIGIYMHLKRKPHDWVIRTKELQNRFNKGRDFILEKLKILKEVGLLARVSKRDKETGKITEWETHLYQHPEQNPYFSGPEANMDQNTENPECGKTSSLENPTHTNNRINTNHKDINHDHDQLRMIMTKWDINKTIQDRMFKTFPRNVIEEKIEASKAQDNPGAYLIACLKNLKMYQAKKENAPQGFKLLPEEECKQKQIREEFYAKETLKLLAEKGYTEAKCLNDFDMHRKFTSLYATTLINVRNYYEREMQARNDSSQLEAVRKSENSHRLHV